MKEDHIEVVIPSAISLMNKTKAMQQPARGTMVQADGNNTTKTPQRVPAGEIF